MRINVSDNGVGIAPEDRERIFNPFQRGASDEGFSGSGIGLSIVRRVMDLHGGRIEVGDAPGGGQRSICFSKPAISEEYSVQRTGCSINCPRCFCLEQHIWKRCRDLRVIGCVILRLRIKLQIPMVENELIITLGSY
ncbi:ATP-binding protein [Flaviaesturariibacter amylovorans]|uniref:ATP-binding protein n=1 Tax=Flaviaesturariibacter amylovorans TaxID=1084520 RepID=UPI003CC533E3